MGYQKSWWRYSDGGLRIMSNDMNKLSKKILKYYKDQKFKPFIIYGERGCGMSTYAMKLMSEVYSRN